MQSDPEQSLRPQEQKHTLKVLLQQGRNQSRSDRGRGSGELCSGPASARSKPRQWNWSAARLAMKGQECCDERFTLVLIFYKGL